MHNSYLLEQQSNKEIQNLHVELAELDAKISEETAPQTEGVLEQI